MSNQTLRKAALLVGAAVVGGVLVFAFKSGGSHGGNATGGAASTAAGPSQPKQLYWDPMLGPSSISNHPGKSAMGMEMVPYTRRPASGAELTVDPAVVQNMGVQTASVTRGPLHVTVHAVGLFKLPEPGLHDISLKIGGWIDKLYADQQGMHIGKGEPLFALYSPDLQVAEQELISAVESRRSLDPEGSTALRKEAENLIASARRKLQLWDIDEQEIDAIAKADRPSRDLVFRSPATGHLEEKMIVQGSAVQPGVKLLNIADHTTMWLDAEVYEVQIPLVKMGQTVEATMDAIPGKTFTGKVTFIYPHVDQDTRSVVVRFELDNPGHKLRPGTTATVKLEVPPEQVARAARGWTRKRANEKSMDAHKDMMDDDEAGTSKPRQRGLGLAVVYGLLRAHRGGFWIGPAPGRSRVVDPVRAHTSQDLDFQVVLAGQIAGSGQVVAGVEDEHRGWTSGETRSWKSGPSGFRMESCKMNSRHSYSSTTSFLSTHGGSMGFPTRCWQADRALTMPWTSFCHLRERAYWWNIVLSRLTERSWSTLSAAPYVARISTPARCPASCSHSSQGTVWRSVAGGTKLRIPRHTEHSAMHVRPHNCSSAF